MKHETHKKTNETKELKKEDGKKESRWKQLFTKKKQTHTALSQNKPAVKKKVKKNALPFKIPFTFGSIDKAKKRSEFFKKFVGYKKTSKLGDALKNTDTGLTREEYLAIALSGFSYTFAITLVFFSTLLFIVGAANAILVSLGIALLFSLFVFAGRGLYPIVYANRKQKEIERNLLPALEDMLVQLNSGVPLFEIMVNISVSDYSALSGEFEKMVRRINAGLPEIEVLDEIGRMNGSLFFRRALWQISNGMRAGSDISVVIKDTVNSLNEEQLIQIQNYGNKLNPAIMFYMLTSVILPALAVTFLTVVASMISLDGTLTKGIFIGFFVMIVIMQFMFLGVIKSMRPSLM